MNTSKLPILLAFLSAACSGPDLPSVMPSDPVLPADTAVTPVPDTLTVRIARDIRIPCGDEIRTVDLFVYGDGGYRPLVWHGRFSGGEEFRVAKQPVGYGCFLAAVANAPGVFNEKAVAHFDVLERTAIPFGLESAEFPIMTGTAPILSDTVEVTVAPLMGCVFLRSIRNNDPSGRPILCPRVRFCGLNCSAELFATDESGASETFGTDWLAPPSDIGQIVEYPKIKQLCYPPFSGLEIAFERGGEAVVKTLSLNGPARNDVLWIDLVL